MRKFIPGLIALVFALGAVNPASADTRNSSLKYDTPLGTLTFNLHGDETRADLRIEDNMRWNVSARYVIETSSCSGGYGGGGCTYYYYTEGYFCRSTSFDLPRDAGRIRVSPVLFNRAYCGTDTVATQGRVFLTTYYTPSGGGCSIAPAYMSRFTPLGKKDQ